MSHKYLYTIVLLCIYFFSYGTHIRSGEIKIEQMYCNRLTYKITLIAYLDSQSPVRFGEGNLNLGDHSDPDRDGIQGVLIPDVNETPINSDLGISTYSYIHTFEKSGDYLVSYQEQNRNSGVLNMDNSIGTNFYIEALLKADIGQRCNNSASFLAPAVAFACTGMPLNYNSGTYDPDGDSLSFELVIPKKSRNEYVFNYKFPNDEKFYVNIPYLNHNKTNIPTIKVESATGQLTWDVPGDYQNHGEYTIYIRVNEWRKISGVYEYLGSTGRDMQIIVNNCNNSPPEFINPQNNIVVQPGSTLNLKFDVTDPEYDWVYLNAYSETLILNENKSTVTNSGYEIWQFVQPPLYDTAHTVFNWTPLDIHVRGTPYLLTFNLTDDGNNSRHSQYITSAIYVDPANTDPFESKILFRDMHQFYTGNPLQPNIVTIPDGLNYKILYNDGLDLPVLAGDYTVKVVIEDSQYFGQAQGVFKITDDFPFLILNTSEKLNINIFPNPVNKYLQVDIKENGSNLELKLFNSNGNKLMQEFMVNGFNTIDIKRLKAGIYFLLITIDNKQYYSKLIKN